MKEQFDFDELVLGPGTDLVGELKKRGLEGWKPSNLPPFKTPLGTQVVVLQRRIVPVEEPSLIRG